jgi:hypothetical protein
VRRRKYWGRGNNEQGLWILILLVLIDSNADLERFANTLDGLKWLMSPVPNWMRGRYTRGKYMLTTRWDE